jgi:hypothetical protein
MIKFYDQVPTVYPSASRDFQYLCWLIDIVLNSVKHNVDDLYDLPNSKTDSRFTELLAMTLGFKVKRNYDQNQLRALVAALPRILKYKGTKHAIEMAGNALVAASGTTGKNFSIEAIEDGELTVILPIELVDVSLFTDLLSYILPAGMTYHIVRKNEAEVEPTTAVAYGEQLLAEWIPDIDWDSANSTTNGLSNLFNVPATDITFANYKNYDTDTPNIGLLDNSIIPMVTEPIIEEN